MHTENQFQVDWRTKSDNKTMKLLEPIQESLHNLGIGKVYLNECKKAQPYKQRVIDCPPSKDILTKMKM